MNPANARAKVTGWERGAAGVVESLLKLGAPRAAATETPSAWLDRALAAVGARKVRHKGNHRYVWPLGDRGARRRTMIAFPALPFPTAPDLTGQ